MDRLSTVYSDLASLLAETEHALVFVDHHELANPEHLEDIFMPEIDLIRSKAAAARQPSVLANLVAARRAARLFAYRYRGVELEPQAVSLGSRADGKPGLRFNDDEIAQIFADIDLSLADVAGTSVAFLSPLPAGVDIEALESRDEVMWRGLLNEDGYALALRLAHKTNESLDVAATRVWTLLEAGKKANSLKRLLPDYESSLNGSWCTFSASTVNNGPLQFLCGRYTADDEEYAITVAMGKSERDNGPNLVSSDSLQSSEHEQAESPDKLTLNSQPTTELNSWIVRFFMAVTERPRMILAIGILLIFALAPFSMYLVKDTTPDSFIPPNHPALIYRDKVKQVFGLKDPMVVAVVNDGRNGIFNPDTLNLVDWLTTEMSKIEGIDPERITSLATEKNIVGTDEGLIVSQFFENPPKTQQESEQIRTSVMDIPLYVGSLVARDGSATVVVAELLEEQSADEIYRHILALADTAPVGSEKLYVAGDGAVSGYLATYIDTDALFLNSLAGVVITFILLIAFRSVRGVMLPNLVVLATAGATLGVMAASSVPFYVITNGLTVILIGIAVGDSIHILSQYYEELAQRPDAPQRELVVQTMVRIWRPVTLTSLTTMAGFIGIFLSSLMPPMQMLGLFAALGVTVAGIYSLTVVPAGLVLLNPKSSRLFRPESYESKTALGDFYGTCMRRCGRWVFRHSNLILIGTILVVGAGFVGLQRLQLQDAWVENFRRSEPIYIANSEINRRMDGTTYLDIIIETPETEGLFDPERLHRIEQLQVFLKTLPHVQGSTSIVDYLKQMNRALNENHMDAYRLPDDPALIAQYFLLYSANADPTDFEDMIDYEYRQTNVRNRLDSGLYTDAKLVVEATEKYLKEHFNTPDLSANISGRANLDFHWIHQLSKSHFRSLAVALVLVWLMASVSFRSWVAGFLALIPVLLSILSIYAVMGFFGIWLAVGTSMFAAIAIGLGVDFAIHNIERVRALMATQEHTLEEALNILFPTTGRALLFNFAALFCGFGLLIASQAPPLQFFGILVALGVLISFIASMTILPALLKLFSPKFLTLSSGGLNMSRVNYRFNKKVSVK